MPLAGGVYAHGYAILQLGGDGGTIRADYYTTNDPGTVQFSETIAPVTASG
jgi:hypothetical protein